MRQKSRPSTSMSFGRNSSNSKSANTIKPRSINVQELTKSPPIKKTKRITPYRSNHTPSIPSYIDKPQKLDQKQSKTLSNNNSTMELKTYKTNESKNALINDPHCIELRNQITNKEISIENIESEDLPNLSEHLREFAASKSYERDYRAAKEYQDMYEKIKEEIHLREAYQDSAIRNEDRSYQDLIKQKDKEIQEKIEQFDKETEEKKEILINKQHEEIENFEKKWSEDLPQTYRKQSSQLLQLFEMEKKLGLVNEFDKAKEIKEEISRREIEEMEIAQRQMEADYESQKATIEKDHQKEQEIFEEARKDARECLIAQQMHEKSVIEKRIKVLQIRQQQYSKPRESSTSIQSRSPVNSNYISIIRGVNQNNDSTSKFNGNSKGTKLLPPLIPPNDQRIKAKRRKERKQVNERNKKFREKMEAKQREDESSCIDDSFDETSQKQENKLDDLLKRIDSITPNNQNNKSNQLVIPIESVDHDHLLDQKVEIPKESRQNPPTTKSQKKTTNMFNLTQSGQYKT